MTFDLRKFERVWEAADSWPEGMDPTCKHYMHIEVASCGSEIVRLDWTEPTAAAIVRDWAVWWLAEKQDTTNPSWLRMSKIRDDSDYKPGQWDLEFWMPTRATFNGTDRTELLYLSCCKVLEIDP